MKTKSMAFVLSLAVFLQLFAVFAGGMTVSAASNANLTETLTLVSIFTDTADIYSEASESSTKVITVAKNSNYPCVEVVEGDLTWYKVMYNSADTGWISSNNAQTVQVKSHQLYSDTSSLVRLVRPKKSMEIRTKADNNAASVGIATTDNVFTVLNDSDSSEGVTWFKVKFGDSEGWISRKSVTITNAYRQIADKIFTESNIPVIYLSPSRQTLNPYSYGSTNECEQMYYVGESLKTILEKNYKCKVYIADQSKYITKNARPMEAANLGADIYLALHSNASPDSSVRYGSEGFYYAGCQQSKTLASNLVNRMNEISPFSKDYSMITNGMEYIDNFGYAEVRAPSGYNMISLLFETQYHDNSDSAEWIIENTDKIAQAIADGLNDTFKFIKVNSGSTTTTTTTTTQSVSKLTVTGSTVNVRSSAGTSGKIVTRVKKGQTYSYTKTKTVSGVKWYYINVNSKTSGWICGKYVKVASSRQSTVPSTTKPTTSTQSGGKLTVTGSTVNVRNSAGTSGKIVTRVKKGQSFNYSSVKTVSGTKWYKIKVNSKTSGWICGKYVKITSTSQTTTTTATAKNRVKITASALNVRKTPRTGKVITSVKKNTVYEYTSTQKVNGVIWYKIKVNSKTSGWISGKYAKKV